MRADLIDVDPLTDFQEYLGRLYHDREILRVRQQPHPFDDQLVRYEIVSRAAAPPARP
jgi:hypothetical protein